MPWHHQTAGNSGHGYGAETLESLGRSRCRRAARLSLLCLAAIATPAHSGNTAGVCNPDAVTPAKVQEIADKVFVRQGVHALMTAANRGGIANIGFVIGADAVAVIDTGGSACDGAALRAAIRARTDLPIRYVINTHVHPDHVFGNAAFLPDRPEVIGHARLPRALAARGAHYLGANRESMGAEALAGTKIVPPGRTVADRLELDLGARRLVIRAHATAHTDNDLTVFDLKTGTLWTGDLVFQGHIPVLDGSLRGWLEVMAELKALAVERAVPGHGPATAPWPAAMQAQEKYLRKLADDLRAHIGKGEDMMSAAERAGRSEKENWQLFDAFNTRNATAGFAELEWE